MGIERKEFSDSYLQALHFKGTFLARNGGVPTNTNIQNIRHGMWHPNMPDRSHTSLLIDIPDNPDGYTPHPEPTAYANQRAFVVMGLTNDDVRMTLYEQYEAEYARATQKGRVTMVHVPVLVEASLTIPSSCDSQDVITEVTAGYRLAHMKELIVNTQVPDDHATNLRGFEQDLRSWVNTYWTSRDEQANTRISSHFQNVCDALIQTSR